MQAWSSRQNSQLQTVNSSDLRHEKWMRHALKLADTAYQRDEVPIGAVVVMSDKVIGQGFNRTITDCDPSAHAEIVALREAANTLKNYRMPEARMYVTLEPCAMCAGAIIQARLSAVIFGTPDPKSGAAISVLNVLQNKDLNHQCEIVSGVLWEDCANLLQNFFRSRRN